MRYRAKLEQRIARAWRKQQTLAALLEAVPPLSCALALLHRLPEPTSPSDALLPPLLPCWKQALPRLREFTGDAARPCQPVLEALTPFVAASPASLNTAC